MNQCLAMVQITVDAKHPRATGVHVKHGPLKRHIVMSKLGQDWGNTITAEIQVDIQTYGVTGLFPPLTVQLLFLCFFNRDSFEGKKFELLKSWKKPGYTTDPDTRWEECDPLSVTSTSLWEDKGQK